MKPSTDINPEELPGVKKKSFAMNFNGGEIWFEHLDGMYGYADLVMKKFRNDFPSIAHPSSPSLVALNVDETFLSSEMINEIAETFGKNRRYVTRLVVIGLSWGERRAFKKALLGAGGGIALKFMSDFEKSKEWLTGEEG